MWMQGMWSLCDIIYSAYLPKKRVRKFVMEQMRCKKLLAAIKIHIVGILLHFLAEVNNISHLLRGSHYGYRASRVRYLWWQ